VLALALCVIALWRSASLTSAADPGDKQKLNLSKEEQRLLDLTNAERKHQNLPPLVPNPVLFQVARAHAANMARQEKMDHNLDGKKPRERVTEAGYRWHYTGENLAYAEVELEEVMKGWMDSPKHRDNILSWKYTEIGLGMARSAQGLVYYTQVFALPKNTKPPVSRESFHVTTQEQVLLDLINAERKQHDIGPLAPNPVLFQVARAHSANMARQEKLDHVLDNKTPAQRVQDAGYRGNGGGENIAYGKLDLKGIVALWMASPKHRANILEPKFTETGIGLGRTDQGDVYYTQVFATPKNGK